MAYQSVARNGRREPGSAAKLALMAAAAGTAATMALGSAPSAEAATRNINQQVLTTGPLVSLLPFLGMGEIGPIPVTTVAGTDITLTLQLAPIENDKQDIYNTINTLPFDRRSGLSATRPFDRVYSLAGPTSGQFPAVLSSGSGTLNTIKAYRAQIASVNGTTPGGYTPFQPGPNGLTNQTNQALILVRNPLRPNGGIMARFAPVLNLVGVDTSLPNDGRAGLNENAGGTIRLNTATLDLAWAYDPVADFPVTLNPFAVTNSLFAGVPTNLLGGVSLTGLIEVGPDGTVSPTTTSDLGLNVASVLGIVNRITGVAGIDTGKAFYGTLRPNDLPLLEPLRLPTRLLNQVFGWNVATPLADALQPALTIAVNTGYTDVQTPTEGGLYNRTFDQAAESVPLLSQAPLTRDEWKQVPGDMARALVVGFQDTFPVLRFGKTAPTLTVDGNHLAITYPPAAVTPPAAAVAQASVDVPAPVVRAPVVPAPVVPAPVSAPVAVESPVRAKAIAAFDEPDAPAPPSRHARESVAQKAEASASQPRSGAQRHKRAAARGDSAAE